MVLSFFVHTNFQKSTYFDGTKNHDRMKEAIIFANNIAYIKWCNENSLTSEVDFLKLHIFIKTYRMNPNSEN